MHKLQSLLEKEAMYVGLWAVGLGPPFPSTHLSALQYVLSTAAHSYEHNTQIPAHLPPAPAMLHDPQYPFGTSHTVLPWHCSGRGKMHHWYHRGNPYHLPAAACFFYRENIMWGPCSPKDPDRYPCSWFPSVLAHFAGHLFFLDTGSSLRALSGCFPCIMVTERYSSLKDKINLCWIYRMPPKAHPTLH